MVGQIRGARLSRLGKAHCFGARWNLVCPSGRSGRLRLPSLAHWRNGRGDIWLEREEYDRIGKIYYALLKQKRPGMDHVTGTQRRKWLAALAIAQKRPLRALPFNSLAHNATWRARGPHLC
jgi:hypothetical protein